MTQAYRMHLPPTTLDGADADQRRVLERARERLGFVPNMYANMVASPGLLETYMDGYERFRADSG
ncbi:MAG: carboxymuconolactone decarboxylase family protein, partial [Pseudomonadota bacterium]